MSIAKGTITIGGETGHWAYCAILGENKIVYGDPMGNDHLPTDLMKHLNPIYKYKFRKDCTDVGVINLSSRPNFPRQQCATICGIVCCLVALAATNRKVYFEIIQGSKRNKGFQMLKTPTYYKQQIRLKFLKMIYSLNFTVEPFLPRLEDVEFQFTGDELAETIVNNDSFKTNSRSYIKPRSKKQSNRRPKPKRTMDTAFKRNNFDSSLVSQMENSSSSLPQRSTESCSDHSSKFNKGDNS